MPENQRSVKPPPVYEAQDWLRYLSGCWSIYHLPDVNLNSLDCQIASALDRLEALLAEEIERQESGLGDG